MITNISSRGVSYKNCTKGKPVGFHDKHMTKDEFLRWSNHQKKWAMEFDGKKLEWTKYKDFQFLQTQEMKI